MEVRSANGRWVVVIDPEEPVAGTTVYEDDGLRIVVDSTGDCVRVEYLDAGVVLVGYQNYYRRWHHWRGLCERGSRNMGSLSLMNAREQRGGR